jgi:hypothetical protein
VSSPHRVRHEVDTDPELLHFGSCLEDVDLDLGGMQRQRQRKTADPASTDQHPHPPNILSGDPFPDAQTGS